MWNGVETFTTLHPSPESYDVRADVAHEQKDEGWQEWDAEIVSRVKHRLVT